MSKELEHLEIIKDWANEYHDFKEVCGHSIPVEEALERLEAIDNAKPSEALNYVNQFINEMTRCLENPKQYAKDYDKEIFYKYKYTFETTIKQALIKSQEQEKVLKIIFEKGLSLAERDIIKHSENYEQYQIKISWWNYKPFAIPKTQEEFNLLKRCFNGKRTRRN